MNQMQRCAWLVMAQACLAFSGAMGAPKWVSVGEFQAGGEGKVAAYSGPVTACRIVCTEGSIIVNTFIVIEGNKKTPISVGVRIPAGQMHEIQLPDGPRNVTGFRISDNARGKYRLEVLKRGAGKGGGAAGAGAADSGKTKKKATSNVMDVLAPLFGGEPAVETTPAPVPSSPEPQAAPPPVAPATPPPVKVPDAPATPKTPPAQPGGTTGVDKLPWE